VGQTKTGGERPRYIALLRTTLSSLLFTQRTGPLNASGDRLCLSFTKPQPDECTAVSERHKPTR
jgi:hypothetical protein